MKFRDQLFLIGFFLLSQSLAAQPIWEKRWTGTELGTDKLNFANAYFHPIEIEPDLLVIDADTGLSTCKANCGQDFMGILPSIVLSKHCPLLKIVSYRGYFGFVPILPEENDINRFPVVVGKKDPTVFRIRLLRQPIHGRVDLKVSAAQEVSIEHPTARETIDFCRERQSDSLKM